MALRSQVSDSFIFKKLTALGSELHFQRSAAAVARGHIVPVQTTSSSVVEPVGPLVSLGRLHPSPLPTKLSFPGFCGTSSFSLNVSFSGLTP